MYTCTYIIKSTLVLMGESPCGMAQNPDPKLNN